jgi:hypothetical protein
MGLGIISKTLNLEKSLLLKLKVGKL